MLFFLHKKGLKQININGYFFKENYFFPEGYKLNYLVDFVRAYLELEEYFILRKDVDIRKKLKHFSKKASNGHKSMFQPCLFYK